MAPMYNNIFEFSGFLKDVRIYRVLVLTFYVLLKKPANKLKHNSLLFWDWKQNLEIVFLVKQLIFQEK